jgi:lactoylglutathione lyase
VPSARDVVETFMRLTESRDDAAFDLVAPDFVNHAAGPQGRDGLRATVAALDHDLADLHHEVHRIVAEGDIVVVHMSLIGVHRNSAMPLLTGVPVSGHEIRWTFIHIWRVADGRIAEHWACRDDVGLLAQVGAWPVRG